MKRSMRLRIRRKASVSPCSFARERIARAVLGGGSPTARSPARDDSPTRVSVRSEGVRGRSPANVRGDSPRGSSGSGSDAASGSFRAAARQPRKSSREAPHSATARGKARELDSQEGESRPGHDTPEPDGDVAAETSPSVKSQVRQTGADFARAGGASKSGVVEVPSVPTAPNGPK
jgi:hypothetical protein